MSSSEALPTGKCQIALLRHPLRHSIAALRAGALSKRHAGDLEIFSEEERIRFLLKSLHLSLCYSDFCVTQDPREPWGAGEAAFLSSAYDVATDWRKFSLSGYLQFRAILNRYAPGEGMEMALDLYHKDQKDALADDGLERGRVAFRFIIAMMGVRQKLEDSGMDIDATGTLLQVVDDILDFEEDTQSKETNCLLSSRREHYLGMLLASNIQTFFPPHSLTGVLLLHTRRRASELLAQS